MKVEAFKVPSRQFLAWEIDGKEQGRVELVPGHESEGGLPASVTAAAITVPAGSVLRLIIADDDYGVAS